MTGGALSCLNWWRCSGLKSARDRHAAGFDDPLTGRSDRARCAQCRTGRRQEDGRAAIRVETGAAVVAKEQVSVTAAFAGFSEIAEIASIPMPR